MDHVLVAAYLRQLAQNHLGVRVSSHERERARAHTIAEAMLTEAARLIAKDGEHATVPGVGRMIGAIAEHRATSDPQEAAANAVQEALNQGLPPQVADQMADWAIDAAMARQAEAEAEAERDGRGQEWG